MQEKGAVANSNYFGCRQNYNDESPPRSEVKKAQPEGLFARLLVGCLRWFSSFGVLALRSIAPRTVFRQIVVVLSLQTLAFIIRQLSLIPSTQILKLTAKGRRILALRQELGEARSYKEWVNTARKLDVLTKAEEWKMQNDHEIYDSAAITKVIEFLQSMTVSGDVFGLMYDLRAGLDRKAIPLTHPSLWNTCHVGTKYLVHSYQDQLVKCLNYIADADTSTTSSIDTAQKIGFFSEARHAYGRTALLLSGGAGAGFYHLGVVKPKIISGASAGSIMAAIIGSRTDDELHELFNPGGVRLNFFKLETHSEMRRSSSSIAAIDVDVPEDGDPALTWNDMLYHLPGPLQQLFVSFRNAFTIKPRPIFSSEHLGQCIRENIGGDFTFQEMYDRTGRIINIPVADSTGVTRLLNYVTAPHVVLWSAALASSSIPSIFKPAKILAKDRSGNIRYWQQDESGRVLHKFTDGSIVCDLPTERLRELFNVNTFIVSQVNPHAEALLMPSNESKSAFTAVSNFLKSEIQSYVANLSEVSSKISTFRPLGISVVSLITQKYIGDITLRPVTGASFTEMSVGLLRNPSDEVLQRKILLAERNTWPLISRIRTLLQVEITLDQCLRRLKQRLADEAAEKVDSASLPHRQDGKGKKGKKRERLSSFLTTNSAAQLAALAAEYSEDGLSEPDLYAAMEPIPAPESDTPVQLGLSLSDASLDEDNEEQPNMLSSIDHDTEGQKIIEHGGRKSLGSVGRKSLKASGLGPRRASMSQFYYRK